MILFIPNESHRTLVFLDTEFSNKQLVQVAMIIYEQVVFENTPVFILKGSINLFIQTEVDYYFTRFTNITQDYLNEYAIPETDAANNLNEFLKGLKDKDTLFIAHGVKQDLDLLSSIGVDTSKAEKYCTYEASKTILGRSKELRLIDVCNESGYFADQHDAYTDAKNVVHAFSYLKFVEAIGR